MSIRFTSVGVCLQRFTWCNLKFHKLRTTEYPYRTSLVTERPSSNFERSLQSTKQIRLVQ